MQYRGFILAAAASLGLSGCLGDSAPTPSPASNAPGSSPAAYSVDKLIGSWGVASYREEKDRARTEAQAKAQCKLPYVIAKGPTDGVMMHVADDTTLHELTLKGGPGGKTYLGFAGPPGDAQDREILSMSDKMFVARYVDPETNTRYGTFIYERCSSART
jgi:hypothetical protein